MNQEPNSNVIFANAGPLSCIMKRSTADLRVGCAGSKIGAPAPMPMKIGVGVSCNRWCRE